MNRAVAPYALASLVTGVAGLLSVLALSRLLTPADYGVYATVLTVATFGQTLGFFWLQTSLLRLHPTAADADRARSLVGALWLGFVLVSLGTAVAWTVGMSAATRLAGSAAAGWWGLPLLLGRSWVGVAQAHNRSTDRMARYVATESVNGLGGVVLAALAAWLRPGSAAAPLAGLTVGALLAAAASPALLRDAPAMRDRPWPMLGEMLAYGGPLSLAVLAAAALATSDRLLVAGICGAAAAGIYTAGYSLAERSILLTLSSVTLATKPLVFRAYETHGAEPARALLARIAAVLMGIGFPAVAVLVAAPKRIASVLVGPAMVEGVAALLPWVAVGALGAGLLTLHFALAFQLVRRTWAMLAVTAPAAALNIGANVLLLPRYGSIAAAWTTVLGYAVALAIAWALTRSTFRVPFPPRAAVRAALACIPLVAFVRLDFRPTPGGLTVLVAGGLAVYAASAWLLDVAGIRTQRSLD